MQDGLGPEKVEFNEDVVSKIIESYTREAGVRNLEREIGSVCKSGVLTLYSRIFHDSWRVFHE